jgi:hypothetical protein
MRPFAEHPHDAGVPELHPEFAQIEGAHLLANAARVRLYECGFTDDEILEWALSYIALEGSGDVESFVRWLCGKQRRAG